MPHNNPTILRFMLTSTSHPLEVMERFHPHGTTVLNRTEWRQKEPRSCGVTSVRLQPYEAGSNEPKNFDVEVEYRPKGWISYTGNTKYDGWTAMVVDRKQDGTLLDGQGKELPEGQPPVYLPYEVFRDLEFNDIEFGEFVGEFAVEAIERTTYEEVVRRIQGSGRFSASLTSKFIASRRHRPLVKLVLSNAPASIQTDGFGTRIVRINRFTPHLPQVLLDQLTELVTGFIEGRFSIKNISNEELVLIELGDLLVDCSTEGQEPRFDCLAEFMPEGFLDNLAKRLIATYEIDVSIVDGPQFGLVLQKTDARTG